MDMCPQARLGPKQINGGAYPGGLLHRFVESTAGVLRAYAQARTPTARTPAGRWFRRVILRMDAGTLDDSFARSVRGSLATLVTGPLARRGITVAIDKHLIPRYDKKEPGALVQSRLKVSEYYSTISDMRRAISEYYRITRFNLDVTAYLYRNTVGGRTNF